MPTEGTIVSSLSNRPLRKREKEALEAHDRLQMVIPDAYVYDPDTDEEIIHGAVFMRSGVVGPVGGRTRVGAIVARSHSLLMLSGSY